MASYRARSVGAGDEVVVEEHDVSIAQDQHVAAAPRRGCHFGPENRDDYGESHDHRMRKLQQETKLDKEHARRKTNPKGEKSTTGGLADLGKSTTGGLADLVRLGRVGTTWQDPPEPKGTPK